MALQSLKFQIRTPLYDETVAFYQRLFSAEVVDSWQGEHGTGTILKFRGLETKALLEIYQADDPGHYQGFSLQFKVSSIQDFSLQLPVEYMSTRPVRRPWGAAYLNLKDPNGIDVIVYQLT